ncbi:MAG: response regulator transcription factor [Nocardioidaceae bacterium]|nr:response regulator transcription factor [Nocardioidaceae bacterium]NUS49818.1 response regulator transcription factor [Nocardioidaceae bacterium]
MRVLVVDDHDVVRRTLAELLSSDADIEVCGTAEDGAVAIRLVDELDPDVVLMDVGMPVLDGIAATRLIRAGHQETHVLVLSADSRTATYRAAMDAGASGYLLKDRPLDLVIESIRRVHRGEQCLDPPLTGA